MATNITFKRTRIVLADGDAVYPMLALAVSRDGGLMLDLSKYAPFEYYRYGVVDIPLGEGHIGKSAQTGENFFAESVARREPSPFEEPLAVIPLKIKDTVIGVISINKLLFQKTAFTTMDYELFTLLAGHAATALFSAKLYSASARKLTTLQGFLDMLKTHPK